MATSVFASRRLIGSVIVLLSLSAGTLASAQTTGAANGAPVPAPAAGSVAPLDFVIGPDDVLSISFWRDKELSADVVVRPDGKISLPLINELQAAGLTPEQLRLAVTEAASKYVEDPTVSVVVRTINSRKVYVVGQVNKPGIYPLAGPMSVVQLIALAGGLTEYADRENIVIVRAERRPDGEPLSVRVNYNDLMKRKNLKQNIDLKAGDTIMIP
jgi:polysaccharide biosynthesis/export protein